MRVFRVIAHVLIVLLLTILTQVGGLAYVIYLGLKRRIRNLASSKIRFHGCYAVRHDDHIHLQI
ncbi:hypothetical protein [Kordia sp.]|uniref:hypothetical protein n=1 Tax=Kordia sp. TaxID=1965332 RepID=UPI003D27CE03